MLNKQHKMERSDRENHIQNLWDGKRPSVVKTPHGKPRRIRIASFNCKGLPLTQREAIANWMVEQDVDVLALQETKVAGNTSDIREKSN